MAELTLSASDQKALDSALQETTAVEEDLNWVQRALRDGAKFFSVVNSLATGNDRTEFEQMPEISEAGIARAQGDEGFFHSGVDPRFQIGRFTSDDDAQMQGIVQEVLGDSAVFTRDKFGNTIVLIDNEPFYVNKPGFSVADADRLAGQLVSYAPLSRFFTYGSVLTKSLKAGAGATVIAGARDVATYGLGADDINVNRDVITGALFALGVPIGLGVAWGSKQMWARLAPWLSGNTISKAGREQLLKAGYTEEMLDTLEPALIREFTKLEKLHGTEAATSKIVEKALPEDLRVPLTRGDVTQTLRDQQIETLMAGGAKGDAAATVAETYTGRQAAAIEAADEGLFSNVLGTEGVPIRGVGSAQAQARALELRTLDKQAYQKAYSNAEKLDNFLDPADQSFLLQKVSNLGMFDDTSPIVQKALKEFSDMVTEPISLNSPGVQISKYFDWRRRLTAVHNRLPYGSTEKTALAEIKKNFDQGINEVIERGYVLGDPQGIKWWQEAVKLRAQFGKDWQASWQGDSKRLISDLTNNIAGELKVTSDEAANYILNASNLGFITKSGLAKGLKQLKDTLIAANGLASPAWQGIQDDILLRLIQNARGVPSGSFPNGQFAVSKFASGWNKLKNSPELMNTLFDATQQRTINHFIFNALKAGSKQPMAKNPSNSAIMLMLSRPLQKLNLVAPFEARSRFGGTLPVVSETAPVVAPMTTMQASDAVNEEMPGLAPALLNTYQAPLRAAGGLFDIISGGGGGDMGGGQGF